MRVDKQNQQKLFQLQTSLILIQAQSGCVWSRSSCLQGQLGSLLRVTTLGAARLFICFWLLDDTKTHMNVFRLKTMHRYIVSIPVRGPFYPPA